MFILINIKLKGYNINYINNLRIISYIYVLFLALDDNIHRLYLALPFILYLIYDNSKTKLYTKTSFINIAVIIFFIFSFFYNKSESTFYHPMINQEITLEHDIYITKSFRDGILNTSKSDFTLKDQPKSHIVLNKGEKVYIVAFYRNSIFNFIPHYYIEIDTNLHGKLLFWSNNFFDTLGTLSNELVDNYSITINIYFKLLSFFYPFALFYLLLKFFKNKMLYIKKRLNFHPLNFILYPVAYYYTFMASVNDGFSSFFLGIPYAFFILWEIVYLKNESKIIYLHIIVLTLAVFYVLYDRSESQIIYPMVGKTYTVANDVNYSYGSFYINDIRIYEPGISNYYKDIKMFQLKRGDRFRIDSQKVTGHADFGINYNYKISSDNFSGLNNYISKNLKNIKTKLSNSYSKNFKKIKTDFYYEDEKQFYISDYELRDLMKTQGLKYKEHRFDNNFTYLAFYLLVYPVISALFILILKFRNNKTKL